MRGKAINASKKKTIVRITPAYAGKRGIYQSRLCSRQDHPRLCGEKADGYVVANDVEGSPPPMRGKEIAIGLE